MYSPAIRLIEFERNRRGVSYFIRHRSRIVKLAAKYRLPTMHSRILHAKDRFLP
jgi:hypothetical protein